MTGRPLAYRAPGSVLSCCAPAREAARSVECASNLRQWGIATAVYLNDHDSYLPFDRHVVGTSAAGDATPGIWFNELPPLVGAQIYSEIYDGSSTDQYSHDNIW